MEYQSPISSSIAEFQPQNMNDVMLNKTMTEYAENLLQMLLEHPDFVDFTEQLQPGFFRPKSDNGNSHHLVLSVNGLYDHRDDKCLGSIAGLCWERKLVSKAEYIYLSSTESDDDRQVIKNYFNTRSLQIDNTLIDATNLRVNRYKSTLSIVAPLLDVNGKIQQVHQIEIDPSDYTKIKKRLQGSAEGDRSLILPKSQKNVVVLEGLEDALTFYINSSEDASVLVCFGTSGFGKINSLIQQYENVAIILDPDKDDQSMKKSAVLGPDVMRYIPTLGNGIDANKAFEEGRYNEWFRTLKKIEWGEVEQVSGKHTASPTYSNDWPEIIPFENESPARSEFPVEALPPVIRESVIEYQEFGQQPMGMIAVSALSCLSLATQGLANVSRDIGLTGPISLNLLVIADSGERKTAVDKEFRSTMKEWQRQKRLEMKADVQKSKALLSSWEATKRGIEKSIERAAKENDSDELNRLEQELVKLESNEPVKIVEPTLFYEDINQQALAYQVATGWPSSSLWSDEAALVVGSQGMSNENILGFIGLLNRLWDGDDFDAHRKQAEEAHISGRRFTTCMMMQHSVFDKLLNGSNRQARGTGFFSRFFITAPISTIGKRPYKRPQLGPKAISRYHYRIQQLLNTPLNIVDDRLCPPTLELSDQAFELWEHYYNDVEKELDEGGDFFELKDFGSKNAEVAARMAACFHIFEHGPVGKISAENMDRGIKIAAWFLMETNALLMSVIVPEGIKNAKKLMNWLQRQEVSEIERTKALNSGPLRPKKIFSPSLQTLIRYNFCREVTRVNTCFIQINPASRDYLD